MILDEIVASKRLEVEKLTAHYQTFDYRAQLEEAPPVRNFYQNLQNHSRMFGMAVIAEVKQASPSKGILRQDFNALQIAEQYERANATAISVLTDEHFFKGSFDYLRQIRGHLQTPLLCKDFIIDHHQIVHARLHGADAILLIARILTQETFTALYEFAHGLEMDCLVEIHDEQDLDKVMPVNPRIIGINNRNLHTFVTDIENTLNLIGGIPDSVFVVSESGIRTADDSQKLKRSGVQGLLVGETLMKADLIAETIGELRDPGGIFHG